MGLAYGAVMFCCAGNVIDRFGVICQTDPSGCTVYGEAGLRDCDCDGTVGAPGSEGFGGMAAMGVPG